MERNTDRIFVKLYGLNLPGFRSDFASGHFAQIIGYLKQWKKDLRLLVNFGGMKVKFRYLLLNERYLLLVRALVEYPHSV